MAEEIVDLLLQLLEEVKAVNENLQIIIADNQTRSEYI